MGTGIYLAYVKVGIRNRLTGFYQSDNDIADILTCLIFLFYLKTGIKQLLFQLIRCYFYIYIFLQPA